jgi:TRAP-type C4-dicarboxylate transport system substrate-binding protein
MIKTSALQQAIETVENLPPDDQEILLNLLQKRQQEQCRANLLQEVKEIRQEYTEGNVQFGSLDQFLTQLDLPKITQIPKDK